MAQVTPRGFRDILPQEALARERVARTVSDCFTSAGYLPVETPLLEDRAALERAGRVSHAPFQLIDSDDSLLMLRPDLTQPIARMVVSRLLGPEVGLNRQDDTAGTMEPLRLRYLAPVVREEESFRGRERQFTQVGVELVRERTRSHAAEAEVVGLLADALSALGLSVRLVVGSVKPLAALLQACSPSDDFTADVLACVHASDLVDLDAVVSRAETDGLLSANAAAALRGLPRLAGGAEVLQTLERLLADADVPEKERGIVELGRLAEALEDTTPLAFDFSIMSSFDYYTGVVFKAYAPGLPYPVASGGRYDSVYAKLGRPGLSACGFACSLDNLVEAVGIAEASSAEGFERPLRIAVPKGSLFRPTLEVLEAVGLPTEELRNPGRKLIVDAAGPFGPVQYVIVRATDAPAFVAFGGADCGMCGRDSLVEADLDLVELWDLGFGGCKFVVAGVKGATDEVNAACARRGTVRIASKYPRITQAYADRVGQQVDIIALHGNIELGPIVGLADRIVDITATGTTLKENDLEVVDEVMECTARFFASPASLRVTPQVRALADALGKKVAVPAEKVCGGR